MIPHHLIGPVNHGVRAVALVVALLGIVTDEPIQVSFSIFLMMAASAIDSFRKD